MKVRLMLVAESGEVLDSGEFITAEEWNKARENVFAARAELSALRKVDA